METLGAICQFLLVLPLIFILTGADQELSTMQLHSSSLEDLNESRAPTTNPSYTTTDQENFTVDPIVPRGDCLIDTEMGLIAVGSAGGLIICLLVTVIVLSCQIWQLQRTRVYIPRSSRSNLDLVSSAGYWDQSEAAGLVGPCDNSVILEEVRADSEMEEVKLLPGIQEVVEEAEPGFEEGAKVSTFLPAPKSPCTNTSTSKDSCSEVPKDIEDMPLVV